MKESYQVSLDKNELENLVNFLDTHYEDLLSPTVYSKIVKLYEESLLKNLEMKSFTHDELKHIEWSVRYLTDMYYSGDDQLEEEYSKKNISELEKSIFSKIKHNLNVMNLIAND